MGSWGVGLYQNDTAIDVREYYVDQLHRGKNGEQITAEMLEVFSDCLNDKDEAPVFWLALADTQWKLGRLEEHVKQMALSCLDSDGILEPWEKQKDKQKRQQVLLSVKNSILSPQPPQKVIKQYKLYQCTWKIGDVFAYKLESEYAKEKGFFGRYLVLRKVDEGTWHPGHTTPIMHVKLTKDEAIPCCREEYDSLEYIQTGVTQFQDRFNPIDHSRFKEDILEKNKLTYEVDEYGLLPEFMIHLITTSKRIIPKKLIFIGNFNDCRAPEKEFVPHSKHNIATTTWKNIEEDIVKRYIRYNKRQSEIYNSDSTLIRSPYVDWDAVIRQILDS